MPAALLVVNADGSVEVRAANDRLYARFDSLAELERFDAAAVIVENSGALHWRDLPRLVYAQDGSILRDDRR
jgi:hypothetical protein